MIRVTDLAKQYARVQALAGVSFDVPPGETFAIIGPNGAGKTTTLKCLLGLVRPDRGEIALGAERLSPRDPRARSGLGYVPQRVEPPAGRTVREVLAFFAALRGLPASSIERSLERVGMTDLATRRAQDLSGGFLQRLSLAQALLGDPALLVLDEPTASLDPQATWEFRQLVLDLKGQGKTIVLCSHLLSEVERVADRVLILVGGHTAALERLSDLRERQLGATRLRVVLDGEAFDAAEALTRSGFACRADGASTLEVHASDGRFVQALDALRGGGWRIHDVETLRPSLEETFLAVVQGHRVPEVAA